MDVHQHLLSNFSIEKNYKLTSNCIIDIEIVFRKISSQAGRGNDYIHGGGFKTFSFFPNKSGFVTESSFFWITFDKNTHYFTGDMITFSIL